MSGRADRGCDYARGPAFRLPSPAEAALLPNVSLIELQDGEGHFVYLNACTSDLTANGAPLCVDREGVDREAVHGRLAPQILAFLVSAFRHSDHDP
jgi:hypothetical protein